MRALSIVGTVLVYVFMLIVSVCSDAIIAIAEVGRFLTVPVAGLVNSIRNRGWIKRAAP